MEKFKIQQIGSPIRRHHDQRQTLIGLKLNKIGRISEVPNSPETWGMIRKVRHLVRVVDEELFQAHELRAWMPWREENDSELLQRLIFSNRKIRLLRFKPTEMVGKTPDFKLIKEGNLCGYCEMKSPNDKWLFEPLENLEPGEIRVKTREGKAAQIVGNFIIKAAQQFDAVNPDHDLPNILAFVNHAPGKAPLDLHFALEGMKVPGGGRAFFIFDDPKDQAPGVKQKEVWRAATSVDLYLWIDPRTKQWTYRLPVGAKRVQEACNLLGIRSPTAIDSAVLK